jgi:hypothetical protein
MPRQLFWLTFSLLFLWLPPLISQSELPDGGHRLVMVVTDQQDTLLMANLADVQVTASRSFENSDAYRRYMKYRRYAAVVYPYAVEAVRAWRDIETQTEGMKRRKAKKYIRQKKNDMKNAHKDALMNLSRTHGHILIKMVERELDIVMYDLIKDTRGGFNAFTWNLMGNLYGISLKEGYRVGEDPILDMVLEDFDISW